MGHDSYVLEVKNAVSLPILRKEFIIDEYQIKETRALGADAILLIVSALSDMQLNDYYYISTSLGLTVLIECHNEAEVERALALNPVLIGINNRNLNTFKTDLNTTIRLKSLIPPEILIVSESGISNKREIEFLQNHNVNAFLIGEQFMKTKEPGIALSKLL
jgi:indole-3-glycerol phosphate synthase